MAKINLPGRSSLIQSKVDERVEFIVNKNLSEGQKASGVVAKVQVRHPAASFVVTVWNKNGRKWVSEPAQEGTKQWFPLVSLLPEVKNHILYLVDNNDEDNSAWYLDMVGEHKINISADVSNPDLGIEAIVVDGNLTYNQQNKGMICKVNVVTTIGSFLGYSIWTSKFGESLYGTSPSEGNNSKDDDKQRGNPGYRLSREATAQVLSFLHNMVDFSAQVEVPETITAAVEAAKQEMAEHGFQPVGDEMFDASK